MLLNAVIAILILGALAVVGLVWWAILQTRPPRQPRAAGRQRRETPPMPTGAGQLEVTGGDGHARLVALPPGDVVSLGREGDNTVVIDEPGVSRHHARLVYERGGWQLRDQGSANGTLLNGRPVTEAPLRPGDTIGIGAARLCLIVAEPAPARPRQASEPPRSPFVVLRLLGEGGISRVLLARDGRRSGRLVALKVLTRGGGYLLEKFRQEGMLGLDHPHIARVFDTGEIAGQPYIALEYIAGPSLRRLLDAGPLAVDEALAVIGQVLAALGYAHRQQIIHRDIKPENIMVDPSEGVKLIDFGIARILAADTRTSHLVTGTPQYMSYEQAVGRPVDQTSDLYAAAIVLYEMLTASVPFSAESAVEIVRQHQQLLPLPARRLNPGIPIRVDSAIQRALAKDPARRFGDSAEFAAALGCPPDGPLPPALRERAARLVEPITG